MSGVKYVGETTATKGIIITTSSGQQVTLSFVNTPTVSVTSDSAIVSFTVTDDSANSYTATSEELITTSVGNNILIATASLSVTKNSDEILTMTWVITVTISTSSGIIYIPTTTPQEGGMQCLTSSGICNGCAESSADSLLSNSWINCSTVGLSTQYTGTSFVTTQLFTDIFHNTYTKGSSNSFTLYVNTTLYIYTPYCLEYFVAGLYSGTSSFSSYKGALSCYSYSPELLPIYFQLYVPSETEPYMGVQIEFTT